MTNFNSPKEPIDIYPCRSSNEITKEYYYHLVGEINRGTVKKAVCRTEDKRFYNCVRYYLTSER